MNNPELTTAYNYDEFTLEKVMPWLNFDNSPALGKPAPDFPLRHLDGTTTTLREIWQQNRLTVVEFGSFT